MRGIVLAAALAGAAAPGVAAAQAIVSDGKMPMPTSVGNVGNDYSISGGTVRGTNLFHSFSSFSVPTGGSATFDGPSSITNILSRVTGTDPSSIDGTISTRSAMPSANFYLINPNGVMFGPNAFLDVGGAFHASTANYIKLDDGTVFSAAAPAGEVLTSAAPQAFGFLTGNPASITLDGSQLVVDSGQNLSLIGGDVHLTNGAILMAPGGTVRIASVASPGEVVLATPDLGTGAFSALGEVTMSGGSGVLAGSDPSSPSGTLVIRSGRLVMEEGSGALVENFDNNGAPVGIDIGVRGEMILRGGALLQTLASGAADAGAISITAGSLQMSEASLIDSTGVNGRPGSIDIRVGSADLSTGALIHTLSNVSGLGGGALSLSASASLRLSGSGTEVSTEAAGAPAGDIAVSAADIFLADQARIRSGSGGGLESAGAVNVTGQNSITLSGLAGVDTLAFDQNGSTVTLTTPRLAMDFGFINTTAHGVGIGGSVIVNAQTVSLANGAQIASSNGLGATGAAGDITVNASGSVAITGQAASDELGLMTFTNSLSSGLFSAAGGSGNAGRVVISTPSLTVGVGGEISVATSAAGNAGTVQLNAASLNINGGVIDSSTTASGDGGAIFLSGSQVNIANGGRVTADSLGAGRTGNVTITASDSIVMSNGSISTRAATSDGGDITLTAPNIVRLEGSQISTSVESGTGSGGNVRIDPQFLIVNGSSITANAFGGPGGNITIIADNYLPSPTSIIEASSALSTPGSIQIASPENNVAGSIAQLPRALVDASRLMRSACSARREGTPSSFTLASRGGVPPDPDGYLPSAIATAPVTPVALARMDSDDCAR